MLSAIVGDIVGSVHEKLPSHLVHREPTPTDDSFLTCACYEWVHSLDLEDIELLSQNNDIKEKLKISAIYFLKKWWAKYPDEGYSRGFKEWAANPDFVQGHRYTNGALMRQSPIAEFCFKNSVSLDNCLLLSEIFASPTHDHEDVYPAVRSHSRSIYDSLVKKLHPHDLKYLNENTPYKVMPLEYWQSIGKFVWDAKQSLAIAYSALYYAQDFQSTINNCIFIGGDVDTYCAIACPIAVSTWPIPEDLKIGAIEILQKFPDVNNIFN